MSEGEPGLRPLEGNLPAFDVKKWWRDGLSRCLECGHIASAYDINTDVSTCLNCGHKK